MPTGLVALLDDVAAIAKVAAASIDDIGVAATRAGTKSAGVVIDDAAVTPTYVTGFDPSRELPMIWKITKGSFKNKLVFLLPAAVLLGQFAPFLIPIILIFGGLFLCYEAAEKVLEFSTSTSPQSMSSPRLSRAGARERDGLGRDPYRPDPVRRDHGYRAVRTDDQAGGNRRS
ncbi:hypothetical protein C8024_14785, partial [Sphingopyxis sp. BSNA05]|nr:hypothetical protein [Sphingopyxis sp. BSNA05]